MRWLPDTLFSRLVVALFAVAVFTVLVVGFLIVRERRDLAFMAGETSEFMQVIEETISSLADLSPEERGAVVSQLREQRLFTETQIQPRLRLSEEYLAATMQSYQSRLARRVGSDYDVRVEMAAPEIEDAILVVRGTASGGPPEPFGTGGPADNGSNIEPPFASPASPEDVDFLRRARPPQVDVGIAFPDGNVLTFRTPFPRPSPPLPRQIFIDLGILMLALVAVLYFMTRTITRPLSNLAEAAEAAGRGVRHTALPEVGARELREATRAFNTMQERLHRYLDSRTRVLRAMSHDLNTPLTRMRLRVETLEDPTRRDRFLADLDEMDDMVNGALNLFRGVDDSEGRQRTDISALLKELRNDFAELGISIAIEGTTDGGIWLKPQALKRCLTNLLSNAAKYGDHATLIIEEREDLVIRVLDDGPGIPEADLERVFEPFYRVESSRNPETGGTGLGLCIARDIAQAHGGSLVLRNRSPHGLEAILTLPRSEPIGLVE